MKAMLYCLLKSSPSSTYSWISIFKGPNPKFFPGQTVFLTAFENLEGLLYQALMKRKYQPHTHVDTLYCCNKIKSKYHFSSTLAVLRCRSHSPAGLSQACCQERGELLSEEEKVSAADHRSSYLLGSVLYK